MAERSKTIAVTQRWLDLLASTIGESDVDLVDLYLADGRTFRLRPDELRDDIGRKVVVTQDEIDHEFRMWLEPHGLDDDD
jgi:hypothetical protein